MSKELPHPNNDPLKPSPINETPNDKHKPHPNQDNPLDPEKGI